MTAVAVLISFWIRAPLAGAVVGATAAALVISWVWRHFGTKVAAVTFLVLGDRGR